MTKNNYKKIIVNTENHYFFWIFSSITKFLQQVSNKDISQVTNMKG